MELFRLINFKIVDNNLDIPTFEKIEFGGIGLEQTYNAQIDWIKQNIDLTKNVEIKSICLLDYRPIETIKDSIKKRYDLEKTKNEFLTPQKFYERNIKKHTETLITSITSIEGDGYHSFDSFYIKYGVNHYDKKYDFLTDNLIFHKDDNGYKTNLRFVIITGFENRTKFYISDYINELIKFLKFELVNFLKKNNVSQVEKNNTGDINSTVEKIKVKGSLQSIGYLFSELIEKGYIEVPKRNGKNNISAISRLILEHFEFIDREEPPTPEDIRKTLFTDNRLSADKQNLFKIPNQNTINEN